jgi:carbamoyl-phosphate synthase large subunit
VVLEEELYTLEEISTYKVETLPKELLLEAKQKVCRQTNAHMMRCLESQVHTLDDNEYQSCSN